MGAAMGTACWVRLASTSSKFKGTHAEISPKVGVAYKISLALTRAVYTLSTPITLRPGRPCSPWWIPIKLKYLAITVMTTVSIYSVREERTFSRTCRSRVLCHKRLAIGTRPFTFESETQTDHIFT